MTRPAAHRRARRGFTLIEIGVVLLVAAMLIGIAIPTLRSVSGATARGAVSKLSANIRATRGTAAVSGQTCRVVFDIDGRTYAVECAEGQVNVAAEKSLNNARDTDLDEEEEDLERLSEAELTKRQILKKAQFAPAPLVPPQQLPGDLEFASIWTSHQEDEYTKGKAYLYFFPSGMGERANIQLRDGDDFFSLHVSALAGRVRVYGEKKDLPDQDEDDGF